MNSSMRSLGSLLIPALSLLVPRLLAAPQGEDEARLMVRGWLRVAQDAPLHERLSPEPGDSVPITVGGQTVGYVFALSPRGFIVTSADDTVEPVIAFSRTGQNALASGGPLAALLYSDLPQRLASAAVGRGTLSLQAAEVTRKWALFSGAAASEDVSLLSNNGLSGSPTDLRIAPLTATRWGQSTADGQLCYNYYTPSNYYCGCIGTAWAQLMRFHQYPTNGIGQLARTVLVNGVSRSVSTRGGNGTGGPYAWSQMPLVPDATSTATQRAAIGALTYDVGVAASSTNYGSLSSFTATNTAIYMPPTVMTNTFGFASAFRFDPSVSRTNAINANLDAGIPLIIVIPDHAVVCDGYGFQSGTAYHHLSLGWDGSEDAWYTLDNIQAGAHSYTNLQYVYANVFPDAAGEIVSGRVLNNSGLPCVNATVTLSLGSRTTHTDSAGIYAFRSVPSGASVTLTVAATGYTFASKNVTLGTSSNCTAVCGNRWGNDFTGTQIITYKSVSGTVTNSLGEGLANLKVVFSNGGGTNFTDSGGHFTGSLPTGWSGTVTPVHPTGYFQPTDYALTNLQADATGRNFLGTLMCFVKASATGANNGSSWANAFTNLASALTTNVNIEIWTASGTYKPGCVRDSAFLFNPGQNVYGGFAGTETRREQRDWRKNVAVLSGDIGILNVVTDNCYTVVQGAAGARIDGFTITCGNSDYAISSGTPNELARGFGGGVFILDVPSTEAASFVVDHCIVTSNRANNERGTYYGLGGGLFRCIARNSLLMKNVAQVGGAAYQCLLENCTVVSNTATMDWQNAVELGAMTNCIVYFNTPYNCYLIPAGYSCTTADSYLSGTGNITGDPTFVNTAAAGFMIATNSPCKNAGTPRAWMTGAKDLYGDCRVSGSAPDMGAYEVQTTHPAYTQLPQSTLRTGAVFTVSVQTRYGWNYRLQYSASPTSVTTGTWQSVSGTAAATVGDGTVKTLRDATLPAKRFYRVLAQ